ncbi:MAG: hypothetical protein IKC51_04050 [Myxococcaceae bacterium]|nr:hypothetical protein [Myxococcaceae bacterium]
MSRPRVQALALVVACLAALALPRPVRAAEDPLDALYAVNGLALRADARLFALYAALNAMGYDEAPLTRALPFAARRFSPIRQRVRAAFRLSPELSQRLLALFEAAPLPLDAYARCALSLDADLADTSDTTAACGPALVELPSILRALWRHGDLPALYETAAWQSRAALLAHLPRLDTALERLDTALDHAPAVPLTAATVLFNALDGERAHRLDSTAPAARHAFLIVGDFGEALPFHIARLYAAHALCQILANAADIDLWSQAFAAHALALDSDELARIDPSGQTLERAAAIDARQRLPQELRPPIDAFLRLPNDRARR